MARKQKENGDAETTPQDTRGSLIEHAGRLFAEKGFEGTSIRDICEAAGANIAAVHYHFGDKQKLYEQTLGFFYKQGLTEFPDPPAEGMAPVDFLEEHVFTVVSRIRRAEKPDWHLQLIRREMLFPTGIFQNFVAEIMTRQQKILFRVLSEIVPEANQQQVARAAMSVSGQIGGYTLHNEQFLRLCFPKQKFDEAGCREIARYIALFSINGLKAAVAADRKAKS